MAYTAPGVYVVEAPTVAPIVGVGTSTPAFIGVWPDPTPADPALTRINSVVHCTNFSEFTKAFGGGFSKTNTAQNTLTHAVRGFFTNGGTTCYVVRADKEINVKTALEQLEAYDDVSMVVAPGLPADLAAPGVITEIVTHCTRLTDRIAILDAPDLAVADLAKLLPGQDKAPYTTTDFAALYTPWLMVADPNSDTPKQVAIPPSGHVAGIYARTDALRGVHKAPANEVVLGVNGPSNNISRSQQETLNVQGANCIRVMSGSLKVWGARTLAGDSGTRAHFKYIPIRQLMRFLAKSIDHGTQWAVFEPNGNDLWAKIIRNVSSFLTGVWAQGALAGTTPQEAFYVKCDAENNPPDQRANGLLVVEVGVAVLYPAEFVVFKIQHQSALSK
ncbi:MAG TPA: phage tail sheath subtilisin-like domain-containing protein [Kofleriaceae bacterium]